MTDSIPSSLQLEVIYDLNLDEIVTSDFLDELSRGSLKKPT